MNVLKRLRWASIRASLLIVLCLVLTAASLFVVYRGEEMEAAPRRVMSHRAAEVDLSNTLISGAVAIDTSAILNNDAFHSTRTYIKPLAPSSAVPLPDYELIGSMGLPQGKRIAFVRSHADPKSRTIHLNDDLDGWIVSQIDPDSVELTHGEQHAVLKAPSASTSGFKRSTSLALNQQTPNPVSAPELAAAPGPRNEGRTYQPPPKTAP